MRYQPAGHLGKWADVTAAMQTLQSSGAKKRFSPGAKERKLAMRLSAIVFVCAACLAVASGCSSHGAPPTGRWEGSYESSDTMIAARLEIDAKGEVFVSAPDAENFGDSPDARAAIRKNLAQGLASAWGDVQPRTFDFDGKVFRKPGGVAPQMEWDPDSKTMMLIVYLGMRSGLRVPLRPVKDFSDDPWPAS
jgi:hypothetical protein